MTPRTRAAAALAAGAMVLLAACSTDSSGPAAPSPTSSTATVTGSATPSPSTSPSTSPSASTAPAPVAEKCYAVTRRQALGAAAPSRSVPCTKAHSAQTYRVDSFDLVRDGHLLAIDSEVASRQALASCSRALEPWLGGDPRLSVLTTTWYTPTLAQADAGARWLRCDVVALNGRADLAVLPASTRNLLATEEGRAQYGLCRTAAPGAAGSSPVPCSVEHAYRAVAVVDLSGEQAPGQEAAHAQMDTPCQDAATAIATDPLNVAWQQEAPTAAQWAAGRHYGICWAPA